MDEKDPLVVKTDCPKKIKTKRKRKTDRHSTKSTLPKGKKKGNKKKRKQSKTASQIIKKRSDEQVESKPVFSMISNLLFYGALLVLFIGAIFFNFNDNPKKDFFGYRFMTVLTNSMAPTKGVAFTDGFSRGAIIILEREIPSKLKKDDIITFYPSRKNTDAYLTHRIIDIDEGKKDEKEAFIKTQGDANTGSDIPIQGDQVVGKVIYSIPNVGLGLNFIRENLVVVTIFFVVLFTSLMTLRYYLSL